MSWLNDLFADGEDQAPESRPSPPPSEAPEQPRADAPTWGGFSAALKGEAPPTWERGQNGASGEVEGMRRGLQGGLSILAVGYRGRELELIARIQTALDSEDLGLPPFPDTVIKLRGLLDADRVDSAEISKLVRSDPGLAEEVWRVASSVAMGGKRPKTLQRAVARLGHEQLWKVAMFVALDEALFQVKGFEEEVLFLRGHGTHVADLAEWLAPNKLKGQAWMAGLLHDAGKLFICRLASEVGLPNDAPVLLPLMDQCHAALGGLVADSWNMPEVASAIALHHGEQSPVGKLVHRADIASHGAVYSQDGEGGLQAQQKLKTLEDGSFNTEALLNKAAELVERDRNAA